jgi:hypothetical protein
MIDLWTYGLRTYFRRWLVGAIEAREDLISNTAHDIYKFAWILHKYDLLGKKLALDVLKGRFLQRSKKADVVKRLARNTHRKLAACLDYFRDN